jgi:hypothetical protein
MFKVCGRVGKCTLKYEELLLVILDFADNVQQDRMRQ